MVSYCHSWQSLCEDQSLHMAVHMKSAASKFETFLGRVVWVLNPSYRLVEAVCATLRYSTFVLVCPRLSELVAQYAYPGP